MNNKSQATSIIYFFVIVIAIFVCSIIVLKLVNSVISPFQEQIANFSNPAGQVVKDVQNSFNQWWDIFIILLFIINTLLLFFSVFLIDIHPAFVVIYIITIFFMFIMGNYCLNLIDEVWNRLAGAEELTRTPLQQFIINHFNLIMIGIVILSGVIAYSKFKYFNNTEGKI